MGAAAAVVALLAILGAESGPAQRKPPAAQKPGPLRVLKANPRYFTDGRGRAVFLTGSHVWWNLVTSHTFPVQCTARPTRPFDYAAYLERLAAMNHNFFRLWTFELTRFEECGEVVRSEVQPWLRTGPGTALDGLPKFDLTQPNPAYYERLRERVAAAAARRIYVSVMLFEGWSLQFALQKYRWGDHPFNAANNVNGIEGDADRDGSGIEVHTLADPRVTAIQDDYVRRVVDTVNRFDNVLYEIANESGWYSTAWQYRLIRLVKGLESRKPKRHPVGMTYQNAGGSNETLYRSQADWISAGGGHPFLADPPATRGRKVELTDTDHHCGICGDESFPWKTFLRGYNSIFMDPLDANHVRHQIRNNLGLARGYAQRMNLVRARPLGRLASTGYCLAAPGFQYLVYQPASGAFTLDLRRAPGRFAVEWLRPATGERFHSSVRGSRRVTLVPPFAGPAVAFVRRPS